MNKKINKNKRKTNEKQKSPFQTSATIRLAQKRDFRKPKQKNNSIKIITKQ